MSQSKVVTHTLANGLMVLCEESPASQSVGLGFFVKTGARDETIKESGVSHFLEHMLFKGTKKRSALDITFHMGNIGAQSNAFTSEENTVYYTTVLPEYRAVGQEILSDMMRPSLNQSDFDTEKNVILEEIALYQDKPQFYLFENATHHFFDGHTVGNSVLGTPDSIKALTRDEMQAYFDRRYAPNNIVFACAGKIVAEDVIAQVEELCGSWKRQETPRQYVSFSAKERGKVFKKPNLQQNHVLFFADGPSAQDDDRYAMGLLSMMLGDSTGSRMYYELIQNGLAEGAGCDTDERDQVGNFYAYVVTSPENLDQGAEITKSIIATPRKFSEADLTRAKTKSISRMVASGELPMGRLMALGTEWQYLQKIHNLKTAIAEVKAVTVADIERALERYTLSPLSEYRMVSE